MFRVASGYPAQSIEVDLSRSTITVSGELDERNVPDLASAYDSLISANSGAFDGSTVVLDVGAVSFCCAAGLNALVELAARIEAAGARLQVIGASPRLQRLFAIARCDWLLAS